MSLKIGEQPITAVFKGNIVLERAYRGPKLVYKTGKSFVTVEPLTATENGTYTAPKGKAYSPVTVDVQPPLGYLTFGNIAYLSVNGPVWDGTMYISDDAEQWSEWDGMRFEPGDSHTIYLRGSGNTRVSTNGHSFTFGAYDSNEGGVTCEGNIENLLDAAKVARGEHPRMWSSCCAYMFQNCTSLTTAPTLPATTLNSQCYYRMFLGCTSLTTAPVLPATTLEGSCYTQMFHGCTSLTTAPALPATMLAGNCYANMFAGCTSLTTVPALPATTLATACYSSMFSGCTSLTTAPALPATTLAYSCYSGMFNGCISLTTAPALPATTLADSCYTNMFKGCTSLTTTPTLPATTLAKSCYSYMFQGCTSLITAPNLPATTLGLACYDYMFYCCTSLTSLPVLPALTLTEHCYRQMFGGCTGIKLSATSTGEYTTPYRIPFQGTGTTATDALLRMFEGTGGTFKGTPQINTTYYTSNAIPEITKITANGVHNVAQYNYADVDVSGANLVALNATDNNTTYDPADYNADGFSSVSVEIAVPQVYVAQKQVSGNTVIYDFGVNVENCAVAPLQDEAARMGVGMDLNFREPRAVIDDSGTVFDDGNFKGHGYEFHAHNAPADRYPSALFAVAPN